jgi:hypothetical protein
VAYPFVDLDSDHCNATAVAGLSLACALVVGSAKEILDLHGWGQPELSDLLLTLSGGVIAGSLVYALTSLQPAGKADNLGISGVYAAFGLVLSLPVGENLLRRVIPSLRSRS